MLFIFRKNWLRTIFHIILFSIGAAIVYYMISTFEGSLGKTFLLAFLMCVLWTYSGTSLWEMYGSFEGNWGRYKIQHSLDKAPVLSPQCEDAGFAMRKFLKYSIYLLSTRAELNNIRFISTGAKWPTSSFRFRLRKVSVFLRLWIKKQKIEKKLRREKKEKFINRDLMCSKSRELSQTYAINNLTSEVIMANKADIVSTIIDQKLMARSLMLGETEILSSKQLVPTKEDRFVMDAPQDSDLISGLYIYSCYITSDNKIVPSIWIQSYFLSYYIGNLNINLIEFVTRQVEKHLISITAQSVELIGICLNGDDLGAPTLMCHTKLSTSLSELAIILGVTDIPGAMDFPTLVIPKTIEPKDNLEAAFWYCLAEGRKGGKK